MPGSPVWPHARMAISFGETATWQLYFVLAVHMNPSTYLGTESERQGTRCVDHDDHSRVIGAPPMSLFRSCTLRPSPIAIERALPRVTSRIP